MKLICLTLAACIALSAGAAAPAPGPTSAQALVRSSGSRDRLQAERKACHLLRESSPRTKLTEQLPCVQQPPLLADLSADLCVSSASNKVSALPANEGGAFVPVHA